MKKLLYAAFLVVLAACGNDENTNAETDAPEDPDLNQAQIPVNANGNLADTIGLPDRPMVDSSRLNDSM